MPHDGTGLPRAIREGALLLALSVAAAFGSNALRSDPLPFLADPRVLALEVDVPVIYAKEAAALEGDHIFLDARDYEAYGSGHIGGAFAVPAEDFGTRYETLGPFLAGETKVIVYGWSAAPAAPERLAKMLLSAGVTRGLFLVDGFEGWIRIGAPIEKGDDPTIEAPLGTDASEEAAPPEEPEASDGTAPTEESS